MTNFCLDGVLASPESDKDAAPSTLSQRLSGLKMTVCLCSPVPACPILQSLLLKRGWEVFYGRWEFLVLSRWVEIVTLGLSGMWREGRVEGLTGTGEMAIAGRNEEWKRDLWKGGDEIRREDMEEIKNRSMICIFHNKMYQTTMLQLERDD